MSSCRKPTWRWPPWWRTRNYARRIAADPFAIQQGAGTIPVTISIGIAAMRGKDDNAASILKRADQALYQAKRDGRNRVVPEAA